MNNKIEKSFLFKKAIMPTKKEVIPKTAADRIGMAKNKLL